MARGNSFPRALFLYFHPEFGPVLQEFSGYRPLFWRFPEGGRGTESLCSAGRKAAFAQQMENEGLLFSGPSVGTGAPEEA